MCTDRVFSVLKRLSRAAGLWLDDVGRTLTRRVRMLLRFLVTTETVAHRGKNFLGEGMFLARAKTCEQGRGEHFGRYRLVDRGIHGPAAFDGILNEPRIIIQRVVFGERGRRE